jgi:hypothetical protein
VTQLSKQAWWAMRQRRLRALANQQVQDEIAVANSILEASPELSRDQALREAAQIVRNQETWSW